MEWGRFLSEGSTCGGLFFRTDAAAATQLFVFSRGTSLPEKCYISLTRHMLELIVEGLLTDAREVTC